MSKNLLVTLAALVGLVGPVSAQNAALQVLNYQDGGSSFTAKWTGAGFPQNQATAPSGYTFVAQWADGYGDRAGGRSIVGETGDVVQGGGDNYQRDFNIALNSGPTMGQAEMVVQGTLVACDYYCNSTRSNVEVATGKKVAFTSGQTLVQVAGYDVQASAAAGHAVFGPVPGATVKIYEQYAGANFPKSAVVRQFSLAGKSYTALTIGVNPGGSPTDCAYPSGFASNQFKISASAPGFKDILPADEAQATGSAMPGAAFIVTLYPSGRSENSTAAGSGTSTPDGLSNTNVPAPAGTDGGGGTGTDDGTGTDSGLAAFFSDFWETFKATLVELVTPAQADVDALKNQLLTLIQSGPLGFIAQQQYIWETSLTTVESLDYTTPAYWQINFSTHLSETQFLPPGMGVPLGYNYQNAYATSYHAPALPPGMFIDDWTVLFPANMDLNPYAGLLLMARALMLIVVWLGYAFLIVRKFIPTLRM